MKNLLIIFSLLFIYTSCSTEEPTLKYTTAIRNTSNKSLHLLVLGDTIGRNTPVYDTLSNTILNPGQITFKRNYLLSHFGGFGKVTCYYAKITFLNNNKGYICEKDSISNLCFTDKVSLTDVYYEKDFTFENGIYYYDITQEDYENAHELP